MTAANGRRTVHAVVAAAVALALVAACSTTPSPSPSATARTSPSPSPSQAAAASPSPEDHESTGLVVFRSAALGAEFGVLPEWEQRILDKHGVPCSGMAAFGFGLHHQYPALTVSVGDQEGHISVATAAGHCTAITASTIDELDAAIQTAPTNQRYFPRERTTETMLDGEVARYVTLQWGHIWTADAAFHHVFAIHDGRPVVIAFDHYLRRWHPEQLPISDIIRSFRWIDEGGAWVTHTARAGFRLSLPPGWREGPESASGFIATSGYQRVDVVVADAKSGIRLCIDASSLARRCFGPVLNGERTLGQLAQVASWERGDACRRSGCRGLVYVSATELAGEPAHRVELLPAGDGGAVYLISLHNGLPYYIRLYSGGYLDPPPGQGLASVYPEWEGILASFTWID